jgi:predicted metal-dependent hydrolase
MGVDNTIATTEIEIAGSEIEYRVVESADATQPRIDVDIHDVKVVVPEDAAVDPHEFIRENTDWLARKVRKYDEYRERAPDRTFEAGEMFPYQGDERVLRIRDVDEPEITDEEIVLATHAVEESSIQDELEALFREQARGLFEEVAAKYADEMGVEYEGLAVRNQRTRWGSCSPKQNLSFNWRLIMAPPEIAEYVVVHELAHLREQNHTNRFWRIVQEQLPDYRERANWLEEHSVDLIFSEEDL